MAAVEISQEALQVSLMLRGSFVVRLLKLRISNEGLAVLAPVFGLWEMLALEGWRGGS